MFVFGWGKEVLRSSNRDRYFKNLRFENHWDPFLISDFRSSQIAKFAILKSRNDDNRHGLAVRRSRSCQSDLSSARDFSSAPRPSFNTTFSHRGFADEELF